ncbi:hypothetical protein MDAP_000213 [Mitosporidium daphniae]
MTIDYACGTVLPILANKNITLRDILSVGTTKHTLILSAMLVDWDWLFESVGSIPMTVFVDGACGLPISLPKNKWLMGLRHPKNPECRIFAPPAAPYSKMHAKLAIVLMESFIRIMITSANLVQGDWEERSNIAYIQDFPASDSPCGGDFGISLCQILKSMGLSAELLDRIQNNYNYGKALGHLIASIPGSYLANSEAESTLGLGRLSYLSSNLLSPSEKSSSTISLEYQCSSIGPYTAAWLENLFGLLSGPYRSKSKKGILKLVYPSEASVIQSEIGAMGFTSLFCSSKSWASDEFPANSMYQVQPIYSVYSLHSKIMTVESETGRVLFTYIGSHNFTPAAWGRISGKSTVIKNWELGIIFTANVAIPYTYLRPAQKYLPNDKPWMQF